MLFWIALKIKSNPRKETFKVATTQEILKTGLNAIDRKKLIYHTHLMEAPKKL